MALRKIPGTKGRYIADSRGLAEIGSSTAMQSACMEVAERGAAYAATIDPEGSYTAYPSVRPAGYQHEPRSAGVITQTKAGPDAIKHMKLMDVLIHLER